MSALPPIADMRADMVHVRFVPIADIVDMGQFGTTARSKLGDTVIPPLPNGRS